MRGERWGGGGRNSWHKIIYLHVSMKWKSKFNRQKSNFKMNSCHTAHTHKHVTRKKWESERGRSTIWQLRPLIIERGAILYVCVNIPNNEKWYRTSATSAGYRLFSTNFIIIISSMKNSIYVRVLALAILSLFTVAHLCRAKTICRFVCLLNSCMRQCARYTQRQHDETTLIAVA